MELRQIRHFVSVADSLNFHRAARTLNMSQPPLSVSIRKLEAELGGPLFVRHARGVSLTEAAEAALPHAREAISAADAMIQCVRESVAGERGTVRIGFVASATYVLIPAIVSRFRAAYPNISLVFKEAASLEVIRSLEAGLLDIGLVRAPLAEAASITLTPLHKDTMMLMMPRSHPLARTKRVRLEDLTDEAFILYDRFQAPNLWRQMIMACETAGFFPKVAEETAHIHTMIGLVESGVGVAIGPTVMRGAAKGRTHCLELTVAGQPLQIGFAMATRRGVQKRGVAAFAEMAMEVARLI